MSHPVQYLIIHGKTLEGQRFRPSDWAERLAGVLSQFRPAGSIANPLSYSPYAMPRTLNGLPCVMVDHRLRQLEPLAWKFACDFALSNRLQTTDTSARDEDAAPPASSAA
ncbi:PhnO-related protein OS=Castellaniella defragrans (strain DSM / CCUG 39792 / 65Phen) OX=1437824 GN=BN940_11541 PE=4 SV=1 [Castellaniella denitrificans]|jgi:hypothetical protein|uniref:DUF3579 domain-containing protein n=1 Tax=Castellaniella TaxID=359336 RepID=UPI002AFF120C|nr:DUF3579 domain-containing protein [Castellaniella sp.]